MLRSTCLLTAAFIALVAVQPAWTYVDLAPTLGRIVRESQTIALVEVDRFSRDKGAVLLKKVRDLKGETGADLLKHHLVRASESGIDRAILEWAEPGQRCVVFTTGRSAVVCLGEAWYQVTAAEDGWWRIGAHRPDLPLAYYGTVSRLARAVPLMVAGKNAVITALPHGADLQGASFDLALNRASMPGLVKVQRVRASLRMPDMAMGVGASSAFVLGAGRASRDELTTLRESTRSADAAVRAESAADIGFLGAEIDATDDLTRLLDDESVAVQLAAASALLRLRPADAKAMDRLAKGLGHTEAGIRRRAARAAGLAGPAAAPLAAHLGALLQDSDSLVSRSALQAIATLGPAAATTREAVTKLLGQADTAGDAADALGRMGPAARPSLKSLAPLLSADAPGLRWAAVRAMAQIGGDDAAPAAQFMIRELPRASEVDTYNMLIYLSLLGPVAKEALPAVRTARIKNPFLRQATAWAIDPGEEMPWVGPMGDSPVVQYIFESYVQELGDHLRPVARRLASKIIAGKAGNVPAWGYKLLARYAEDSLAVFVPALAEKELAIRERATVALGYMGRAAATARPQVSEALRSSQEEREQRLLQWCLREITP